ncbi:type II toxin-antitoxin system PemK/MazF family toxin [Lactobacillus crispatus]|uniref:Type II toxin-antitoxin system PemK/MazF family toxin n=1 Tax=Lactobacillus crispatus TaxID=47770 RepID=A0A7H9E8Y0_9LACO|nr:type II toxin-antitoxin system PemK/MazF family toxin [Lactobacillus crispatus]QLL73837.1 type II toxin-antitoxin system PemK/MazF family toxin [Lactobacillus crispatus]
MAEYKRYSHDQKRRKLAKFNSVYYDGNPDNWKVSRLPNWMNFYGHSLNNELNGRLPKYYRKFKQGTVVMIDYGVPIGNELGGKHFGVVISNNDTKYKRKVMVVPLSSHYHKGYVDLGFDLMEGISYLLAQRIIELQQKINKLDKRLNDFVKENPVNPTIFNQDERQFLDENNIDYSVLAETTTTFNLNNVQNKFTNLINDIKNTDSWEKYPGIYEFVSSVESFVNFADSVENSLYEMQEGITQLNRLGHKLERYNKQSFAVISDVKAISKLRVTKLSHFTISGNAHISNAAMTKIKTELIKTID